MSLFGTYIKAQAPASSGGAWFGTYIKAQAPASFSNTWCMDLDGVNERFISPDDVLDITGAMSISAWVKVDNAGSLQAVVCKDKTGGSGRAWNLYYRGTVAGVRRMRLTFWNTDGTANTLSSSTVGYFEDGAWHHVVVTYDGTAATNGVKMYVDGALDTQMTASSTGVRNYTGSNSKLAIGSISGGSGWLFGGAGTTPLDEIAVWDGVVLTSGNVTSIYNSGVPDDLASFAPDVWCRMGDFGVWTTLWTSPNKGSLTFDWTSENVEEADRIAF